VTAFRRRRAAAVTPKNAIAYCTSRDLASLQPVCVGKLGFRA
jgi:hypothetical protein